MSTIEAPSIAVIPCGVLGDSMIVLVLAENLRRQGFNVTYYSDAAWQLKTWFGSLEILPSPKPENLEALIEKHDVILNDVFSPLTAPLSTEQKLQAASRLVMLSTVKDFKGLFKPPQIPANTRALFKTWPALERVINGAGRLRIEKREHWSMADHAANYCGERFGLDYKSKQVKLTPPTGLVAAKHPSRVMIFGTTGKEKQYSPGKMIAVARQLKKMGYQPRFIVLPHEVAAWERMARGIPVLSFSNLADLATLLYESGLAIANDSGGGHLASLLGVPTVTVYKRSRDQFEFRPGWSQGSVVRPYTDIKILGKRIWRLFLPPGKVVAASLALLEGKPKPEAGLRAEELIFSREPENRLR